MLSARRFQGKAVTRTNARPLTLPRSDTAWQQTSFSQASRRGEAPSCRS
jgi:hypothetical protein